MTTLHTIVSVPVCIWLVSFLVEAVRRIPHAPSSPVWAPDLHYEYVIVNRVHLRYLRTGTGPTLVLLHTLRTQIDIFQRIIPELAKDHTVFTFDYAGHGYSDIPCTDYNPDFFIDQVDGFLSALDINEATIVGESIGGPIGLHLLSRNHPRIRSVVSINAYDYGQGRGIMRGSFFSRMVFYMSTIPVIGATMWRYRWFGAFSRIIRGSVRDSAVLPEELVLEMHRVGNRPWHYRAFMSLISYFPEWESLRQTYPSIERPVLLLYGAYDWSTLEERQAAHDLIPEARMHTVPDGGHLLSLEKPEAVIEQIRRFVSST